MISVIIPSRNERFLHNTIKEVINKASGDVECIAVLDGYWPPKDEIIEDDRVVYLHKGKPEGMRRGINDGVAIARYQYIMKLDGHCMLDEGYDKKLLDDMQDNWVIIPRRKRLDAENWCIQDVGKPDIDACYLSFPDNPNDFGGKGLNGKVWQEKAVRNKDIDFEDEMSFQGSCWFMKKSYFYELELMDYNNYGDFWNEAQEIGLKAWLSGGAVKRNKKTWYAHLHKGKRYGRGYNLDHSQLNIGSTHTLKWIKAEAWEKQTIPLSWLIKKFMPVPTWDKEKIQWLEEHERGKFDKD